MAEEEAMTESVPLAMEDNFTHWSRYVEVSYGDDGRVIAARQDPDSFVLGTTVWDSSKTMLKFIEQHEELFRKYTSICELGSGCGALAGIAAAINNRGLSDVVLTDIAPVLPWLKENVRTNLTASELERVRVEVHNWGTPPTTLGGPFDCILCADVVYEKDCVRPLFQSIFALSHRKTVIYFANERRAPHVREEFMHYMTTYFNYKEIPRSELDKGYIKDAIEVFELRPKKRKIPTEMVIPESTNEEKEDVVHPLWKGRDNSPRGDGPDPYDRDLWDDLLK
ncbi:hypothetical protein Poli38472_009675 [Pythium oligandrum]|uniref:Uncharacterized protein n=1 Tax=Pythium oligandrum TaxID=41045 RepID=A0A8K1CF51_PYTOL|nr:hypothetical protein Poli38472_009675 [Pythium oligandrum]|eukprot:TMW62182.1 hypothetical protein Poli38472_009675 [Pythium oligandrum]